MYDLIGSFWSRTSPRFVGRGVQMVKLDLKFSPKIVFLEEGLKYHI